MDKILKELLERYINKLIKVVDIKEYITNNTDVYTFLACNIPYDVIKNQLLIESSKYGLNTEEVRLLYREQVIEYYKHQQLKEALKSIEELIFF
ncbi:hypothetical protein [Dysgonomonas sp. 520]|uniref:hypothetical protein n=1 Tax=Dysgonomonas sp. 520 TaxID=2302931 RepID=UPI0013D8D8C7|nr:hypothetical protein [Dysgonomonas sp. 520]NDW10692.1 hypothetical protein [Dysgonomonas sp. 520]